MRHNERRARTVRSILALQEFTAAELAANAGLNRDQVYEILAELKKEGILLAESSKPSDRAAHRPLNLYRLHSDPDIRRRLAEEIAPFVSLGVDEKTEPWRRADQSLDEIDLALADLNNATRLLWSEGPSLRARAAELKRRLDEVQDDLEIAFYESGARSMATADSALAVDAKRLALYRDRLHDLVAEMENAEALTAAQQRFSMWMRELIQIRNLTVHDVTESLRTWTRKSENSDFRRMLHGTLTELNTCIAPESSHIETLAGKRESLILGSFLAETAIRCSADANVLVDVLRRWKAPDDSRWHYNLANACALLGERNQARIEWQQWAGNHFARQGAHCFFQTTGFRYPAYRNLAIFSVPHHAAKRASVDRLERELGEIVTSSVVAFDRLSEFEPRHYRVVATLFDPVGHAPHIEISETLRARQPEFFVYGPLAHRMQLPGVPVLRLATVLVSLGIRDGDAWGVADHFCSGYVLVIAYSAEPLNRPPAPRLKEVFATDEVITSKFFQASTPGESAIFVEP